MNETTLGTLNGMPLRFDYSRLRQEDVLQVKRKTNEIRTLISSKGTRVYGSDVFAIGAILLDVRRKMSQQLFDIWLEAEAQVSKEISGRYIAITRKLGHRASKLQNVSVSILYELTLPSYPQSFLEKVLSGEHVPSLAEVRRMREPRSITIPADQSDDTNTPTIPPAAKRQIAELEKKVQSLTENYNTATKEIERLSEDRKSILDRHRVDKGKLDRIIMVVNQINNEDHHA